MLLIGMFDSPFVRRVAVSLHWLRIEFEHADWAVGRDFERIRQYNPLVRVPTLVLDDAEMLCESAAILDYLDERVGAPRALLPALGKPRRYAKNLMAIAMGAADFGRDSVYERVFRPADKRHAPWVERRQTQMHGALAWLERECQALGEAQWLIDGQFSQADISLACAYTFLNDSQKPGGLDARYPALARLAERCEQLPEFKRTRVAFAPPRDS